MRQQELVGEMDVDFVLFDAVGTLLYPEPPVAEVYYEAGRQAGSDLGPGEVARRFRAAFARHTSGGRTADLAERRQQETPDAADAELLFSLEREPTSAEVERQRWRAIIGDVFDSVADEVQEQLFERLWAHFAAGGSWRLYEDALSTLEQLATRSVRFGVASNFDERLGQIVAEVPLLAACPHIYHSADIGASKPSPLFYRRVAERIGVPPERIVLVGDDWLHDVVGPLGAGWQAVHLNRQGTAPDASGPWTEAAVRSRWGGPAAVISSLDQLLPLLP